MRSNTANPFPEAHAAGRPEPTRAGNGPLEASVRSVREEVATLRQALLRPDAAPLEQSLPGLEEAVRSLQDVATALAAGEAGMPVADRLRLRDEVARLQADLQGVARLTSRGAEFWRGWARLLGLDATVDASYTPRGAAGKVQAGTPQAARISLEG